MEKSYKIYITMSNKIKETLKNILSKLIMNYCKHDWHGQRPISICKQLGMFRRAKVMGIEFAIVYFSYVNNAK